MSLRYNAPVAEVIASRAANSLALMGVAWVVSGVLGFALGMAAALREGRLLDRFVRGYCFVLAASPTFWVGLLLLMVFSVWLGWFPLGFSVPVGVSAADVTFADALHHMALPAITLSVVGVANVALHTRAKAIDVLNSDYVRFARPAASRAARRSSATACASWRSRPSRSSSPRSPRSSAARCSWKRCSAIPASARPPSRPVSGETWPARRHRTCVGGARVRGELDREPHLRPGGSPYAPVRRQKEVS